MSGNIKSVIDYHITQLKSIQIQLENIRKNPDPNEILGKEMGSKLMGAIAEEIFKSREARKSGEKIARAILKSDKDNQLSNHHRSCEDGFNIVIGQVKPFLSSISIIKPNLMQEGNSQLLLKKLATLESVTKIEPKIRKAIVILSQIREEPLISNNEIPRFLEDKKKGKKVAYYDILKELENNLRNLIESKLSKLTTNWWKERIPEDVRKNAEERRSRNEGPWPWQKINDSLIAFVDFTDYSKIIIRRDNWNDVFKGIFNEENWISSKLRELEPIRNAIAHSRNLSTKQIQRLELYSKDILECINLI